MWVWLPTAVCASIKCGNRFASPGLKILRDAILGSNRASLLAEAAAVAGVGRFGALAFGGGLAAARIGIPK